MSITSVDLPEPDTPVTHVISPSGNVAVASRRLLPLASTMRSRRPGCAGRRCFGTGMRRRPLRYAPVSDSGSFADLVGRALRDDESAVRTGARAEVDDVIGLADGVFVVLDDEHGVAEVAQPHQRVEQALVVALVQADRGLVEDVHHADQAGADLAGEPDALGLAAGERFRAAIERQVVETDVAQERQAVGDFAHQP